LYIAKIFRKIDSVKLSV